MILRQILSFFLIISCYQISQAQDADKEALQAEKAEKEAVIAGLQAEIAAIDNQLNAYTGWKGGAFGTLGFNLSSFNNWRKGANPNSVSSTIMASINAFANLKEDQYFWRNSGGINVGWQKLDINHSDAEDADFETIADVFKLSSLFGYNISDKLALSALGEYNTSILSNINNPGILDLGAGVTWLPMANMVVVIQPLNYHWVFGDDPLFGNALGAKLVVDYSTQVATGLNWKSNLSSFLSYSDSDPTLSEYTWTNSLSFTVFNGIGVGIEFAIRGAEVEFDGTQNYWVFGLSYAF